MAAVHKIIEKMRLPAAAATSLFLSVKVLGKIQLNEGGFSIDERAY